MIRLASILVAVMLTIACARPLPVPTTRPSDPVTLSVIPIPTSHEISAGEPFLMTPQTMLVAAPGGPEVMSVARYLRDLIGTPISVTPLTLSEGGPAPSTNAIVLTLDPQAPAAEGYELRITREQVAIRAREAAGLFYGVQTLRQLLPPWIEHRAARPSKNRVARLPPVHITDAPRFAWRGAMLDVARHFFGVEDVKRYIDLLALYKLNRLHLHLADDQGWRIEITSWPNLARHGGSTEVGGGAGGFYTQQEYQQIVNYARDRFITIIPEIDMPGHTNAALASYAELNCDDKARPLYTGIEVGFSALCVEKDVAYTFVDDVVREISRLTPGAYFHIGGDEVKTLPPDRYAHFIDRVQTIVQSHGKQMIGWDEIADVPLANTSIVQHWRPKRFPSAAAAKGVAIILSPADKVYLDMKYDTETPLGLNWAGYVSVRTAYDWDPTTFTETTPNATILGVEAPLWSETLDNMRDVEQLAFPRLLAVAEVGWSDAARRAWSDFSARLGQHGPRLTALGVNFYRSPEISWGR